MKLNESDLAAYQLEQIDAICENNKWAAFLPMGSGKTVIALTAINRLIFDYVKVTKVLVISHKKIVENVWENEAVKWGHLEHLTFSTVKGSEKQRKAALNVNADVYLLSRDNIAWFVQLRQKPIFDAIIIDESDSFKNPRSLRFKALRKLTVAAKHVILMCGTPCTNGIENIWAQVYLLDNGKRLGNTYTAFMAKYFNPHAYKPYTYTLKADAEKQIYKAIADICISLDLTDIVPMPNISYETVKLQFSETEQKQYNDFEKVGFIKLFKQESENVVISPVNVVGLLNKLQQFANGTLYDENKIKHSVHDVKLNALCDLITTLNGKPCIVTYLFNHDKERIYQRLKDDGVNVVIFNEGENVEAWNKGAIQVLLLHPASGGHGLNLQFGGCNMIWYSPTYNLAYYQQTNARLYRRGGGGVDNEVSIQHLITENTIDVEILDSLKDKDATQKDFLVQFENKKFAFLD